MKKIFNIQNRIVAKADKTMEDATVMIELSVHMLMVTPVGKTTLSSTADNPVEATTPTLAIVDVIAPGAS